MRLRVEPSPSGGYVVRADGEDVPVSRHDTEEEAEAWVARHARGAAPTPGGRALPHFVGLDDGTQILLRMPHVGDGLHAAAAGARIVAVHPATGAILATIGEDTWVDPAWDSRGLGAAIGDLAPGRGRFTRG